MALPQRRNTFRHFITLLTVLTLLLTLIPISPLKADAVTDLVTLSKTLFPVGYAQTSLTATGSATFPLVSNTKVRLYDATGKDMQAISDILVDVKQNQMTFTLAPGLPEGKYSLVIQSYTTNVVQLSVLSNYDPTNVRVTPGVDRDIRIDWTDPTALDLKDVEIKYAPINQSTYTLSIPVPLGTQTYTLKNLINNQAYKIWVVGRKSNYQETQGVELTNSGKGYLAVDQTPPGDVTNIQADAVPNGPNVIPTGLHVSWTDPADPDLKLITIQYAEHGTTNWSDGFVVAKGVQNATLKPMNMAKRYDLRFTKSDNYGNYGYQIDTHGGYGYTLDTSYPNEVTNLNVSSDSDTGASLTWYDPTDDDFHHVNVYLRSDLTDWVKVGTVNKDVQTFSLSGLAPNINYQVKVTSVDKYGNEQPGVTDTFTCSTLDMSDVPKVKVSQELGGGLQLSWANDDTVSDIDLSWFKVYYAPLGSTDWKETAMSNKTTLAASLRDMPTGTFQLQLRLYDRYGVQQELLTLDNGGDGYYTSTGNGNGPNEVSDVRILPSNGQNMVLTWNAASTSGTHIEIYEEATTDSQWTFVAKVNKRDQRYVVTGLDPAKSYDFRLVVVDDTQNTRSAGVTYNNSGHGYNLLGGDTYPPGEVTDYSANVSYNALSIAYTEPTDVDFDAVNIYATKVGTSDSSHYTVPKGSSGTTIRDLLSGSRYTLRITTQDIYGNESNGVTLDNDGQGYLIQGTTQAPNEVRNALLIPNDTQLTVRFQEPVALDYNRAGISIREIGDTDFTDEHIAYKGNDEVTFSGLDRNAQYQVQIVTYSNSGRKSNGILLGGDSGISLAPIPDVTNASVTPGDGRLSVSWTDPAGTMPSAIWVQVKPYWSTSSAWSDPLMVVPGTNKAVFQGLDNDTNYRVRITTVVHGVGSIAAPLDNNSSGYKPADVSLVVSPAQISSSDSSTKSFSILGTNTSFPWYTNDVKLKLYDEAGNEISDIFDPISSSSQSKIDFSLQRNLDPGTYHLVVHTPASGDLSTDLIVTENVSAVTLLSSDVTNINFRDTSSLNNITLTGTGFASNSTVMIDGNRQASNVYDRDSQHLMMTLPTNLEPGEHKITVYTNGSQSNPLGLMVYPFKGSFDVAVPSQRTGSYQATLTVQNLDTFSRSAKIEVVIRRNGVFVETREIPYAFAASESKKFKFSFGGANSPYVQGPTNDISLTAYVVDSYTASPLAAPITFDNHDLNL